MIIIIDKWFFLCYSEITKKSRRLRRPNEMEKKLRYSHQREAIYQYLLSTKEHPTAEMIYNDLREEIPALSLGTVYRNLKLLEDLGKVRRVASFQNMERYDAICSDHVHFLCSGCGCVSDVMDVDPEALRNNIPLGDGYRIAKFDLTLTGMCPQCAAKDE